MALAIANIFNIFTTPTDVFLNLKQRPTWVPAFVFIAAVSMTVALATFPLTSHITHAAFAQQLDKAGLDRAEEISERLKWAGIALMQVMLLLRWLMFSAFLYFIAILMDAEVSFKTVYALTVHSEMIIMLMAVLNILLLYAKGTDRIVQMADLQAIVGLDYFLKNRAANPALFAFLNSINIFNIWYIATLGIGMSVVASLNRIKSTVLVAFVFFLGVGFQVVLTAITSNSGIGKGI